MWVIFHFPYFLIVYCFERKGGREEKGGEGGKRVFVLAVEVEAWNVIPR